MTVAKLIARLLLCIELGNIGPNRIVILYQSQLQESGLRDRSLDQAVLDRLVAALADRAWASVRASSWVS